MNPFLRKIKGESIQQIAELMEDCAEEIIESASEKCDECKVDEDGICEVCGYDTTQ